MRIMKLISKKLKNKLNKFIKISNVVVKTHPELVVICFHEYFQLINFESDSSKTLFMAFFVPVRFL